MVVNKKRRLGYGLQRSCLRRVLLCACQAQSLREVVPVSLTPCFMAYFWLVGAVKNADMCKWDYALAACGSQPPSVKPVEISDVLLEASRRGLCS